MNKQLHSFFKIFTFCLVTSIVIISLSNHVASATTPYFNVAGGDVFTGDTGSTVAGTTGTFSSACSTNGQSGIYAYNVGSSPYQGAGTDLAALAPGVINGFVTSNGAFTSFGNALTVNYNTSTPKNLTFANTVGGTFGGSYGSVGPCVTDYYSFAGSTGITNAVAATAVSTTLSTANETDPFGSSCATKSLTGSPDTTYCWVSPPSGSNYISISGPTTAASGLTNNLVIFVDGDAVINSSIYLNQNYSGGPSSIPSLYIVASGNINIANTVTNLAGIYVAEPSTTNPTATGFITTCAPNNDTQYDLTTTPGALFTNCSNQLTVDGAFEAKQVRLNRAGGDVTSSPAETFMYNPNSWIVNPFMVGAQQITTPSGFTITNLPPVL